MLKHKNKLGGMLGILAALVAIAIMAQVMTPAVSAVTSFRTQKLPPSARAQGMTVEQYEATLVETYLPTIKGNEIGLPVRMDNTATWVRDKDITGITTLEMFYHLTSQNRVWRSTDSLILGETEWLRAFLGDKLDAVYAIDYNPWAVAKQAGQENLKTLLDQLYTSGQLQVRMYASQLVAAENTGETYTPLTMSMGSLALSSKKDGGSLTSGELIEVVKPDEGVTDIVFSSGNRETNITASNPSVYLEDRAKPQLLGVDVSGHYLTVRFNEPLRLANESLYDANNPYWDNYRVRLFYTDSESNVPGYADAELIGFQDNNSAIVLWLDMDDEYIANNNVNATALNFTQQYMSSADRVTALDLYVSDGTAGTLVKETYQYDSAIGTDCMALSPFTDYAGNSLGRYDWTERIFSASPKIKIVSLDGTMISDDCSAESLEGVEEENWPKEIDRSNIFAGVGDQLHIELEVLSQDGVSVMMPAWEDYKYTEGEVYLCTNVYNADNEPIKLPLESTKNTEQEADKDSTGLMRFGPLVIEEGMYISNAGIIKATQYVGSEKVCDIHGNPIESNMTMLAESHDIKFAHHVYVDTAAPTVEVSVQKVDGVNATLAITATEMADTGTHQPASGFSTKILHASFYGDVYVGTESLPVAIEYALTADATAPTDDSAYKVAAIGKTAGASEFDIPMLNMHSNTNYLHIRVNGEDISLSNLQMQAKIEDFAGNTATTQHAVTGFALDTHAPTIALESSNLTYDTDSTTFTGVFAVSDTDLTGATASYTWDDGTAGGSAAIENGKVTVTTSFTDTANATKNMTLTVTDAANNSTEFTHQISFDATLAAAIYRVGSDITTPSKDPVVLVSSPVVKESTDPEVTDAIATTLASLTYNGTEYVRVFSSEAPETDANLFDFTQGTWYQVVKDATNYTTVTSLTDNTVLSAMYGDVTVNLATAFADLTPVEGAPYAVGVNEGYIVNAVGTVKYAPQTSGDTYTLNNFIVTSHADGTVLDPTTTAMAQTLAGYTYSFNVANTKVADWGIADLDFANSSIVVTDSTGAEVAITSMTNSTTQSFTVPTGNYATGAYNVSAKLVGKNGAEQTVTVGTVVVDNVAPVAAGLKEYGYVQSGFNMMSQLNQDVINYHFNESDEVDVLKTARKYAEPGQTLDYLVNGLAEHRTNQDDPLHYYVLADDTTEAIYPSDGTTLSEEGVKYRVDTYCGGSLYATFKSDIASTQVNGISVGEIETVEFWGYDANNVKTAVYTETHKNSADTIRVNVGGNASGDDPLMDKAELADIPWDKNHNKTIYYRVKMSNGMYSSVKQLRIYQMQEEDVPSATVTYDNIVTQTLTEGYGVDAPPAVVERVISAEVGLVNANSEYSNVTVYRAYRAVADYGVDNANFNLERYTKPIVFDANIMKYNFVRQGDYHTGQWSQDYSMNYLKEMFIIADEYGNLTTIKPFFIPTTKWGSALHDRKDDIPKESAYVFLRDDYGNPNYYMDLGEWDEQDPKANASSNVLVNGRYVDLSNTTLTIKGANGTADTVIPIMRSPVESTYEEYNENYVEEMGEFYEKDVILVSVSGNFNGQNTGFVGAESHAVQGLSYDDDKSDSINLVLANPVDEEKAANGESMHMDFILNLKNRYGSTHEVGTESYNNTTQEYESGVNLPYVSLLDTTRANITSTGEDPFTISDNTVYFNTYATVGRGALDYKYTFPTDCNAVLSDVKATDAYGAEHLFDVTLAQDSPISVDVSSLNSGEKVVKVTFTSNDGETPLTITREDKSVGNDGYVDTTDKNFIVENNGTATVTVTVTADMKLIASDSTGTQLGYFDVQNISFSAVSEEMAKIITPTAKITAFPEGYNETSTSIMGEITVTLYDTALLALNDENVSAVLLDENGAELTATFDADTADYTGEQLFAADSYHNLYGAVGNNYTCAVADFVNAEGEPIKLMYRDFTAPSVQMVPTISDGTTDRILKTLWSKVNVADAEKGDIHPELTAKENYTEFTNWADFMDDIGWAKEYEFAYEIADRSETSVFVKTGSYADLDALSKAFPDGYTTESDVIEGVTLDTTANTLTVTDSATFTLFIVDEHGQATVQQFEFEITDVSFTPTVQEVKVNDSDDVIYMYVTAPEDVDAFEVTNTDVKQDAETQQYYFEFTANGSVDMTYISTYNGFKFNGKMNISVTSVGETKYEVSWSKNKTEASTNQDVVATITFNRTVKDAILGFLQEDDPRVSVELYYQQIKLTYSSNMVQQPVTPKILLSDGVTIRELETITLDAVDNIDKDAPKVTVTQELATNGRSVTLTFTSDQDAYNDTGVYGKTFTKTVKANGAYEYTFTDKAGNLTKVPVSVTGIIDSNLALQFSTDETTWVDTTEELTLNIGDKFYVRANRNAVKVTFNKAENPITLGTAGTAKAFTMAKADKENPSLFAEDAYGSCYYVFTGIKAADSIAPTIRVTNLNISASIESTVAELETKLLANVVLSDNLDSPADLKLTVSVTKPTEVGLHPVTYTVTDTAGNEAVLETAIRIFGVGAAQPTVNGIFADREGVVTIAPCTAELLAGLTTGEPFTVMYKAGVKTAAQVKIDATTVVAGQMDAENDDPILMDFETPGFYTVCIVTQGRDYYRFVVYVEE